MTDIELKIDTEPKDNYEKAKKLLFETDKAIQTLTIQEKQKLVVEFAEYKGMYGLYQMMQQYFGWGDVMAKLEVKRSENEVVFNIVDGEYFWYIHYLDGYFRATTILLDELCNKNQKSLTLPILFNFSHYIEIWVKMLYLCSNDKKSIKELCIDEHNVSSVITTIINDYGSLEKYKIPKEKFLEIKNKYEYFENFPLLGRSLSESSRFATGLKSADLIIDLDKLEEIEKDGYRDFHDRIIELLELTNNVTKQFFVKFFSDLNETENI